MVVAQWGLQTFSGDLRVLTAVFGSRGKAGKLGQHLVPCRKEGWSYL